MFIWIVAFFSGVASLAYEVLWYREFALLLGNTAQASSLVLAAIFDGAEQVAYDESILSLENASVWLEGSPFWTCFRRP